MEQIRTQKERSIYSHVVSGKKVNGPLFTTMELLNLDLEESLRLKGF